jgi:hypothetical protein
VWLDEEVLPEEQDREREHDGEDEITIVLVHEGSRSLSRPRILRARVAGKEEAGLQGSGWLRPLCLVDLVKRPFQVLGKIGEVPL